MGKKKRIKLVIPEAELRDFSGFKSLKLNLDGRKPKGRNLYKRQLNKLRRVLRW